jgi:hypothetical protein
VAIETPNRPCSVDGCANDAIRSGPTCWDHTVDSERVDDEHQTAMLLTESEWACLAQICRDDALARPNALHLRRKLRERIIEAVED